MAHQFQLVHVPLRSLDDAGLQRLSKDGQLYLTLVEMQTIQRHFRELGRDPTDVELETIAQTWSEHCSHKTLAGRIAYRDERGERRFENMLKETIFAATQEIRRQLGQGDWCVSVFKDNAGDRSLRRAVTTSASRSKRTIIPRRWSRTAARTPAWAASFATRSARAWAPSRSATPTCSASLRPIRRPTTLPPGRAASAARAEGSRLRRARLRQPDGHSHGQRCGLFRSALSGQPAGLLRQRRPDSARQVVQRAARRAIGSWRSAGAPGATAFTARRSARPS